ncbi:MAG: type I glutamate--ammonia ligase [Desulfobacterales bacterium]|jgi:glutamine synthetase
METLIKQMEQESIRFINFQFTTLDGSIRQLIHPARQLEHILEKGLGFDGSSCKYVPVNESDLNLKPDLSTYRILPWGSPENRTARLICDVYSADGSQPFTVDPRCILKRIVDEMKLEFGASWEFVLAPEIEFFLLEKNDLGEYLPHDRASYFEIPPYDKGTEFRKDLSRALESMGMVTEKNHHEVPNGKHEITFAHADAVRAADNTMTYRQVVKYMAGEKGLIASFMPKPFVWTYGCGMHVHLNLRDVEQDSNLFCDQAKENWLSDVARHFIAGLLRHARGLTGITNPTVNSYKRLVPGWEAPVYISWGFANRSSLLRIPAASPKALRIETRNPDSSCNPYLAYAALLIAGLDGVRRKMEPPPAINDNIYALSLETKKQRGIESLPGSLAEALTELEADETLCKAMGELFIEKFLELKWKESHEFATTVHPWELEKYVSV